MKKNFSLYFMCFALIIAFFVTFSYSDGGVSSAFATVENRPTIIIDAGHGGIDGGAVAYDGTAEKVYNLALAKKLQAFFDAAGYKTVMTREDDGDTDGDDGFNKKKDIAKRLVLANSDQNAIYISLHLNLSTSSSDKGFQIFYGKINEKSKELAEAIYNKMVASNVCSRVRSVAKAPSGVFLQQHITIPCVLAECGFISNGSDYEMLKKPEYQSKLMFTLFCAVTEYLQ